MTTAHCYAVTVVAETRQQADRVMAERIYHDEDYGFSYTVDTGVPTGLRTAARQYLADLQEATRREDGELDGVPDWEAVEDDGRALLDDLIVALHLGEEA